MKKKTKDLKYDNNSNSTTVDDIPFQANWLYYILQPSSDGGIIGRYKRTLLITIMLIIGLQWMQIVRLYLSLNDLDAFLQRICELFVGEIDMFKAYIIVMNKDRLWNLLDVTRYGFTTCSSRDPSRLHKSLKSLTYWLKAIAIFVFFSTIVWILSPFFMKNRAFTELDGNVGYYKANVFNYWYPISESMYNWLPIWFLIYIIEAFVFFFNDLVILMFDYYVVTMCFMLNAQFDTISAAFETLGRRPLSSGTSGILVEIEDTESYYYDELIFYINDNKRVVKILDEFYDIIRPAIIIQTIVSSVASIIFLYTVVLAFVMGYSLVSSLLMNQVSAYLMFTCQLFIYCYIFNLVDIAKSTLNSGLYGSNWTEMSLKFQKTLLMAMCMNSSHKRQMKFSPKLIINLELFMAVMKFKYSIVSVLLKISSQK